VHIESEKHFLADAIKAKQPLIANLCDSSAPYGESIKEFDVAMKTTTSRLLCMPLTKQAEGDRASTCVGAIICTNKSSPFDAEDVELLKLMSPNFTSFIKRAVDCEPLLLLAKKAIEESSLTDSLTETTLQKQTERALGIAQLLRIFADAAGPIGALHPLLRRVEAHLAELFGAQRCELFLPDPLTRSRLVRASHAAGKDAPVLVEASMGKGMLGGCWQQSKLLRTSDLKQNEFADADADAHLFGGDDYSVQRLCCVRSVPTVGAMAPPPCRPVWAPTRAALPTGASLRAGADRAVRRRDRQEGRRGCARSARERWPGRASQAANARCVPGAGVLANKRVDFAAQSQPSEAAEFSFLDQLCFAAALDVVRLGRARSRGRGRLGAGLSAKS
jgi:hypothetical protein